MSQVTNTVYPLRGRALPGFGSAGDGTRSLRYTQTGAGTANTPRLSDMADWKRTRVARLDEPSAEEIRQAIKDQQCPWCDDRRTFRNIGAHWSRGHGIDLQEVRDKAGIRKRKGMMGEEATALRSALMKEKGINQGGRVLRPKGGKRQLSAYGIEVQRAKMKAWTEEVGIDAANEQRRKANKIATAAMRKTHTCVNCGCHWQFLSGRLFKRKTCSPECRSEWSRKFALANDVARYMRPDGGP